MISFGEPKAKTFLVIVVLIAMVAAMAIGDSALPAVGQVPGHVGGEGCYCHNDGVAIYVNSTDMSNRMRLRAVEGGKSFSLLINTTQRYDVSEGLLRAALAWMPDMGDNPKFRFDPQEVKDNSPLDISPSTGTIVVLFKITAPEEPGWYTIQFSAQGFIVSFEFQVKEVAPAVFASIVKIEVPSLIQAGALVSMNVTLQNTGSAARRAYMYATDDATGEQILAKVYSTSQIAGNETVTLSGTFAMPNRTLSLVIHSGHEKDGGDIDDDKSVVSVYAALPSPPIQIVPFDVLVKQWVPWIAVIAASLAAVPLVGSHAGGRKRLFQRPETLKMSVVEVGSCGVCKTTIGHLGRDTLSLLSPKVTLAPIITGAVGDEPVDVAFVVGSVRTEEDVRTVRKAREKARLLVAYGACAVFGLLPAGEAVTGRLSNPPPANESSEVANEIKPLSDYVKVDLTIPGCPPPHPTIHSAMETILHNFDSIEKR